MAGSGVGRLWGGMERARERSRGIEGEEDSEEDDAGESRVGY
jgi:hypothetical protein